MSYAPGRWTPIYSKVFDPQHELAGDPVCRRFAWCDLCDMAQKESGNRIVSAVLVSLERGELVASVRFLAQRWRWSRSKVQRFLDLLASEEVKKIETVRETPSGTVYRLVTHEVYALGRDTGRDSNEDDVVTTAGHSRDKDKSISTPTENKNSLEGKGGAGGKRKRAAALPSSWEPNEGHAEMSEELHLNLSREAAAFRDHARANGRTLKDWDAGFRNWLRKAVEFGRANGNGRLRGEAVSTTGSAGPGARSEIAVGQGRFDVEE